MRGPNKLQEEETKTKILSSTPDGYKKFKWIAASSW
jgi:hypothetical protein